jgi:hypothetical protein
MATILLLFDAGEGDVNVDPVAIDQLAALGVTHLTFVRDARTFGVVVEGWAFEPAVSTDAAVTALSGGDSGVRVLTALGEMALSTMRQKGVVLG